MSRITHGYWADHALSPVLFGACVEQAGAYGARVFVECGPHPVLAPLGSAVRPDTTWLASIRRDVPDDRVLTTSVAQWYCAGGTVDWRAARTHAGTSRQICTVDLPGHPLRQESPIAPGRRHDGGFTSPGTLVDVAGSSTVLIQFLVTPEQAAIAGHVVRGRTVLPAAATIGLLLSAGSQSSDAAGGGGGSLHQLAMTRMVDVEEPTSIQISATPGDDGLRLVASVRTEAQWHTFATAIYRPEAERLPHDTVGLAVDPAEAAQRQGLAPEDVDALYRRLAAAGLQYGPAFRCVRRLWRGSDVAVAEIATDAPSPSEQAPEGRDILDPRVLDAALHAAAALLPPELGLLVPTGVDRIDVAGPLANGAWARVLRRETSGSGDVTCDVDLVDPTHGTTTHVRGLTLRAAAPEADPRASARVDVYTRSWAPVLDSEPAGAPLTVALIGPDRAVLTRASQGLQDAGWRCHGFVTGTARSTSPAGVTELGVTELDVTDPSAGLLVRDLLGDRYDALVLLPGDGDAGDELPQAATDAAWWTLQILAAVQAGRLEPSRVVLVTRDALPVTAGDGTNLVHAVLSGCARTAVAEGISCVQVDLPSDGEPAGLLPRAIALGVRESSGGHLALRDGTFWRAGVRPTDSIGGRRPCPVRPHAAYLVVGATGGLGRHTVEWLLARGADRVVATTRRHDPQTVAQLTALGRPGQVEVRTLDVGSRKAVDDLVADLAESTPALRGVIHAAGVTRDATVGAVGRDDVETVFAAKVLGAWNLHRALPTEGLDFVVFYSSAASLLGSPGQAAYVAANAFEDALAHLRRSCGMPGLAVNWGPWAGTGLAARDGVSGRLALRGIRPLAPDRALARLAGRLPGNLSAIGLACLDVHQLAAEAQTGAGDSLVASLVTSLPAPVAAPVVSVDVAELTELALADRERAARAVVERPQRHALGVARARWSTLGGTGPDAGVTSPERPGAGLVDGRAPAPQHPGRSGRRHPAGRPVRRHDGRRRRTPRPGPPEPAGPRLRRPGRRRRGRGAAAVTATSQPLALTQPTTIQPTTIQPTTTRS